MPDRKQDYIIYPDDEGNFTVSAFVARKEFGGESLRGLIMDSIRLEEWVERTWYQNHRLHVRFSELYDFDECSDWFKQKIHENCVKKND